MRLFLLLLLSIFCSSHRVCYSAQNYEGYSLKGDALRAIGLDLAVEAYLNWDGEKSDVNVLSTEDINDRHGKNVANVFRWIGESPEYTINEKLMGFNLYDLIESVVDSKKIIKDFWAYVDTNNIDMVISSGGILFHRGLDLSLQFPEIIEGVLERKIVVSNSGGNSFLRRPSYSYSGQGDADYLLLASSVDPNGLPSGYSSEGPSLTVSVPDNIGIVYNPEEDLEYSQGYTSGAQPVLAKTIYLMISVLPKSHRGVIKGIIEYSANKTLAQKGFESQFGSGLLNSYLSLRLAMEVQKQNIPVNQVQASLPVLHRKLIEDFQDRTVDFSRLREIRIKKLLKINLSDEEAGILAPTVHGSLLATKDQVYRDLVLGTSLEKATCMDPMGCREFSYFRRSLRLASVSELMKLANQLVQSMNRRQNEVLDLGSPNEFNILEEHEKLFHLLGELRFRKAINFPWFLRLIDQMSLALKVTLLVEHPLILFEAGPQVQNAIIQSVGRGLQDEGLSETVLEGLESIYLAYLSFQLSFSETEDTRRIEDRIVEFYNRGDFSSGPPLSCFSSHQVTERQKRFGSKLKVYCDQYQ